MNKSCYVINRLCKLVVLSSLLGVLLACNTAAPPQPVASTGSSMGSAIPASAMPKAPGKPSLRAIAEAQGLNVPKHTGGSLKLSDLRGQVLVVDFWGTWCAPCRKQAPQLAELNKRYRDQGLTVIGMSLDDQKDDQQLVNDFIKKTGINYTIAYPGRIVSDAFLKGTEDDTGSPPIPQLFIFSKDGKLVEHLIGEYPDKGLSYLEQVVKQQLALN
jgi:thiol-disulfide isomerase/thioredoxin